ncbi:hypothetical protein BH09PSE3_BH09PSE3_20390 [soil metagenome]
MADPDWLALGVALLSIGLLVSGVIGGRMPADIISIEPQREKRPVWFWTLGTLYGVIACGSLWLFVRSVVW